MKRLSERQEMKRNREREMQVYKRDDMIQKARFSLTVQEQRCVLYAISKIKPTDSVFQEYQFDIKDFYTLCGFQKESYTELKQILTKLKQKTWWVETSPGVESTVSWFNKVRTDKGKGIVTIRFDDDMMPFLLQLSSQDAFFTKYSLISVLPMKSQYSPRLYEILKSYQKNNTKWFFDLENLKDLLNCNSSGYRNFNDFRRFVLQPAVDEINKYTDLKVMYELEKEGRKVYRISFYMLEKSCEQQLEVKHKAIRELDGQATIEDIQTIIEEVRNSEKTAFFQEQRKNK